MDGSGATREGEPAQGGRERRRRQRRGAEVEKRESTPAVQAARREAGEGSGQREVMAAAWAQRREDGRGRGGKTQIRGGKPGEIWAVGFASSTQAAAARAGLPFTKVRHV